MLVVMKNNATQEQIEQVCEMIRKLDYEAHPMPGAERTAICITGNKDSVAKNYFTSLPGVSEVIQVTKSYKLVSRETKEDDTIIHVNQNTIGKELIMIAGPCSVEDESTSLRIAELLKKQGINFFRAGAYKPRSSPYSFQGLGEEGLNILEKIKKEFDMVIVTEVMDAETLPAICHVADILQVGTRNMANFSLLKTLGQQLKPVLLKRGMSATVDEYLQAAEYIMLGGNYQVILCERGIRTFNTHCRNTLDVAAIPELRERTHLPVLVDPSHAAGITRLVMPLARAGVAAGAQGLLIEVHDDALNAYSDGQQALHPDELACLTDELNAMSRILNQESNQSENRVSSKVIAA